MIEFFVIGVFAVVLLRTKSFDFAAVALSCVYGLVIWRLCGVEWILVLFTFLVTSLYATRCGRGKDGEKHEHRGADNVLSNGIVPFMSAVLGLPYFYLGSISAALADTLASEIGKLSVDAPVLIVNPRKKVEPGLNGGVTKLGTLASIGGSVIIASLSLVFYSSFATSDVSAYVLFFAVVAGGALGSVVDSVLGMAFENKGVMTNGSVNFSATLCGGIITTAIVIFL
ncbi:MAG: hypothetical protein DRN71_02320 [Candidatus Nanohalarchaeota archaeon]|nr:MAG: hypothetical protein DRN71_02320 [Candidatus Nanohaloarchaeota archaeon]